MMLRNDIVALRSLCLIYFLFVLVLIKNRYFSEKLRLYKKIKHFQYLCCKTVIYDWAGFRSGSDSLLVQMLLQNICTSVDSLFMLGCDVFMFLWFWCSSLVGQMDRLSR